MSSTVLRSSQIKGRGIGKHRIVPTINLKVPTDLYMMSGVYAAWVELHYPEAPGLYMAAVHFGPRPVIGDLAISLEVHILNSEGLREDYDPKNIAVELIECVREIRKFNHFDDLKKQIGIDVQAVQKILAKSKSSFANL